MEEVDEIVLHTLRQVGCDLEEINSLRDFSTETVIEGVVRCLKMINPSLDLSHHAPQNMSARYRLGSTLASLLTEMGFKGEIGYQTFLYSNETDIRKIFLFLVESLPKESEKALDEPLNKTAMILKEAAGSLSKSLKEPWLPVYCKRGWSDGNRLLLKKPMYSLSQYTSKPLFTPLSYGNVKNNELYRSFFEKDMRLISEQVNPGPQFSASVLEANSLDFVKQCATELDQDDLSSMINHKEIAALKREKVTKKIGDLLSNAVQQRRDIVDIVPGAENTHELKGSRFTHALELQFTSDKKEISSIVDVTSKGDSEEEKQKKREDEIKELQAKVDSLSAKLEALAVENKNFDISSQSIVELIKKEEASISDIKEKFRVKKCTLSLLPDADTNIEKLQNLIDASSQRLVSLANQWEQHRVPLIDQYRELKELSSRRVSETQRKLEEIKTIREKIKSLGVEARQKEETHKHLITAYEKLTKDVSRSAYTRRIMEIVGNIKKQKSDIDKVLLDTRNIQKEINKLSGKLERTFTVTDELVFKDAKKDEAVRRAYKYLAALHENCSQLVVIVEETGTTVREIREIEDQIDQENQKKVAANLERITSDFKQMQQENASLMGQLK